MNTRLISHENWQRIDRLLAGECSEQDISELEAALLGDLSAQKAMLEYCQLHIDLAFDLRAETVVQPLINQLGQSAPAVTPAVPGAVAELHSSAAPETGHPLRTLGIAVSGWCVAACAGLVALLLWLNPNFTTSEQVGGPLLPDVNGVARADAKPVPFAGQSLRLDSGTAKLVLPNIGYVVLEGPVDFDLLSDKRARLKTGRIKMRVTEENGRGFVVETPDGEITDLGTEFGVEVVHGRETGLVVFEGAVDLRVAESSPTQAASMARLVGGEGALFNRGGPMTRINSILTGNVATFVRQSESKLEPAAVPRTPIIVKVDDNLRSADTKKFYEIVSGGLQEDATAHVDTPQEWNGITTEGIPSYLIGADYVKMFNRDSITKEFWINVALACPAKLYVFLDARSTPPAWLQAGFRDTGDRIGLDAMRDRRHPKRSMSKGAGVSVDEQFTIWERVVNAPGTIHLGTNLGETELDPGPAMYGIAAVSMDAVNESHDRGTLTGQRH